MTGAPSSTSSITGSPLVLAIEISNPSARGDGSPGVALLTTSGEPIGAEPLAAEARHDDDLMPAIDRLFARTGRAPADIERVAVSVGPGGFTGLRVAVVTAKLLAHVAGAQTVAVPTSDVAMRSTDQHAGRIGVLLATKGDRAWLAVYEDGELQQAGPSNPEAVRDAKLGTLVADPKLPEVFRAAVEGSGARPAPLRLDPMACAQLGLERAATTPADLVPLYGREPEAVRLWEARKLGS